MSRTKTEPSAAYIARHGAPGQPATIPTFRVYATFDFRGTASPGAAAAPTRFGARRAALDTIEAFVEACEERGWEHREVAVGRRDVFVKAAWMVSGDLAEVAAILPDLALITVGRPGVLKVEACVSGGPTTAEEKAVFEALCLTLGVRRLWA